MSRRDPKQGMQTAELAIASLEAIVRRSGDDKPFASLEAQGWTRLANARDAERLYAVDRPARPASVTPRAPRPARRLRSVPLSVAALAACVLFVLGVFAGQPAETALPLPAATSPRIASGVVETVADDGGVVYLITPGVTVEPASSPVRLAGTVPQ